MVLAIYGAGDQGREVLILAQQINNISSRWSEIIFIDDNYVLSAVSGRPVISFQQVHSEFAKNTLEFVIATGEPKTRSILREKIYNAGYTLTKLIHPSVLLPDNTVIGDGTIIGFNSFISCDVTIGMNVLIQPFVSISHDDKIGNDSVISTFACVAGRCIIESEAYIGLHSAIKEKTYVGKHVIVGMGSIVTKDVPDSSIVWGNPARVKKENINRKVFK